jgi:hypothetical protein
MAELTQVPMPHGAIVSGSFPVDQRLVYDNMRQAWGDGEYAGNPFRLTPMNIYQGLHVWIRDEERMYYFREGGPYIPISSARAKLIPAPEAELTKVLEAQGVTFPEGTPIEVVIRALFDPSQSAQVVSFTATPEFGMKAAGTVVAPVQLSAEVTSGASDIKEVKISKGSDILVTRDDVPNGGTITATDSAVSPTGTPGTYIYTVTVEDVDGGIVTHEDKYVFDFPVLAGSIAGTMPTTFELGTLEQILTTSDTFTYSFDTNSNRMCVMVPKVWGSPVSIVDGNNLNIQEMFDVQDTTWTNGSYTTDYSAMIYSTISSLQNFAVTFKFNR